jgi:hypothetical protein
MGTANTLISTSLRLVQAKDSIENATGPEAIQALAVLNRMLESWRVESLMAFSTDRVTGLDQAASTQTYTIGSGATWNVERPVNIIRASHHFEPSAGDLEYPVEVITEQEWQLISDKDTESSIVKKLYYEREYDASGFGKCHLWPVPDSSAHDMIIYVRNVLAAVSTLATTILFPPGYEEAMVYNLAVRLAPEYGVPVAPEIYQMAIDLKGNLKVQNKRVVRLRTEKSLRPGTRSGYNIRTNRYG